MISVVIPTLNEAGELPRTLAALRECGTAHEVVVVDAGSIDGTCERAAQAGARVLVSPRRQRAAQMNLGAEASSGTTLVFLHADTRLKPRSLASLEAALDDVRVAGGAFARRFDHPSLLLRWTCRLADLRGRHLGWFLGDQAIFARREVFARLGGYRDMDLFEDLDFARRLRAAGRTVLVTPPVLSSARRFQRGVWARVMRDFLLTCQFVVGVGQPSTAASEPGVAPGKGGEQAE